MYWRLARPRFESQKGAGNRRAFKKLVDPRSGRLPDVFAWTGLSSAFRKAGHVEVARRSPTRPIMRLELDRPTKLERGAETSGNPRSCTATQSLSSWRPRSR